ncbi:MAG TPA: glycine cleavage system aminomethyltransferase GcvT [Actinomycetota bacterium]|jgi:aminomethyltransferase|nr:glycine cleavage system aminomethyltransferase GcvT [Actinomycetota bacterium]
MELGLKRTPLEEDHKALGAKMGEFGGWFMPIEYRGVLAEHTAVRTAVGMFDLTHLGKIDVAGAGAADWLQSVLTNDLSRVETGAGQYNLVPTEQGGIVDDLIAYRVEPERWLVVPNAANTDAVLGILSEETRRDVVVEHRPDLCTIAVQGPGSPELIEAMFPEAEGLVYMHCREGSYREVRVVVARSGYTGERGYELFVPDAMAAPLWRELIERGESLGLTACGLGARDTLRTEMGYPLHGNDISTERTPLEAGLSWAVSFDKGEFRGRAALLRQKEEGIPSRLRGLRMTGKLIPRPHYPVFAGDEQVGETTSGTFSPTLRGGIAMAYVAPPDRVGPGDSVEVDIRGRRGQAEVVKPPFVDRSPK